MSVLESQTISKLIVGILLILLILIISYFTLGILMPELFEDKIGIENLKKQKSLCKFNGYQISNFKTPITNISYLETVLGFSYGVEIREYLPLIKKFESNYYYKRSKNHPIMTYTTVEYRSKKIAMSAYEHLYSKWSHSKYHLVKIDKLRVTFFGTDRQTSDCFNQLVQKTLSRKGFKN